MDSFSVSIAGGMRSQTEKVAHAIKVATFFGGFQALMPFLGWLIGEALSGLITAFGPWIAFILLGIIGAKMIRETLSNNGIERKNILNTKTLLLLSVATSIDAFIVGITLSLLEIPFIVAVSIIGIVTFILSFLGFLFGKKLGKVFSKEVEVFGGVILIIIGLKILIEHLI